MNDVENLDLGLKDYFVSSFKNKTKPKHFLRQLRWELRYAWRRAWLGYDDVDMFECFETFRVRMIKILEDFIKYGSSDFNLPKESEHYEELLKRFTEGYFEDEETKSIYETMIFHLHMMDKDYVEKKLFGKCVYDDNYSIGCRTEEERKRIANVVTQNKNAFMKLFSLFYFDLWD